MCYFIEDVRIIYIPRTFESYYPLKKDNCCTKTEKDRTETDFKEDQILPYEKWLVAFESSFTGTNLDGTIFLRQFYAPGFYEAYDIVATYAEKSQVQILWFQEKRNCGVPYINTSYPELESLCTYCNYLFNHGDPIPCPDCHCSASFCSRKCLDEHCDLKHN
jgi:hypothetical protein